MAKQGVDGAWFRIFALRDDIERRCSSLLSVRRAFDEMSLRTPRVNPPELAFYQAITWLYAFYMEAGRVSLRFLSERLPTYALGTNDAQLAHYADVRLLRTFLQHNLNLDSRQDVEVQRACERWFSASCGSYVPHDEIEWADCLRMLLGASESYLALLVRCVREIERDESVDMITQQWRVRLSKHHPKHEFERIVEMSMHNIGQDSLDPKIVTARYYDKWSNDLRSRSEDYVFEKEASRLVEQTLLNEMDPPIPISGNDIIREFGIPPGREVARLLRRAKAIYLEEPANRNQLMRVLMDSEGVAWSNK